MFVESKSCSITWAREIPLPLATSTFLCRSDKSFTRISLDCRRTFSFSSDENCCQLIFLLNLTGGWIFQQIVCSEMTNTTQQFYCKILWVAVWQLLRHVHWRKYCAVVADSLEDLGFHEQPKSLWCLLHRYSRLWHCYHLTHGVVQTHLLLE